MRPGSPVGLAAFGRQTTLNVSAYCAPASSISAGQPRNRQAADARDTVYGSDGGCVLYSSEVQQTHARCGSWTGVRTRGGLHR
jgi:hypothetical protein